MSAEAAGWSPWSTRATAPGAGLDERRSQWLREHARQHHPKRELLAALLSGQTAGYARRRLGFVVLRLSLRTALHTLDVYFLMRTVPFAYLAPLFSYRALAAPAAALHWGALESVRSQVRVALQHRKPTAARTAVEAGRALVGLLNDAHIATIVEAQIETTRKPGVRITFTRKKLAEVAKQASATCTNHEHGALTLESRYD